MKSCSFILRKPSFVGEQKFTQYISVYKKHKIGRYKPSTYRLTVPSLKVQRWLDISGTLEDRAHHWDGLIAFQNGVGGAGGALMWWTGRILRNTARIRRKWNGYCLDGGGRNCSFYFASD